MSKVLFVGHRAYYHTAVHGKQICGPDNLYLYMSEGCIGIGTLFPVHCSTAVQCIVLHFGAGARPFRDIYSKGRRINRDNYMPFGPVLKITGTYKQFLCLKMAPIDRSCSNATLQPNMCIEKFNIS